MGNKIYSLILCILFLSCLALPAKAQDTAIAGLPVCPANYRTQQDSGAAPYFVYDYAAFSPQKGASYRFIPFPNEFYKNTFLWDFGDHSPRDTNYIAFHYYPDTGAYTVTLTILHHSGMEKCVSRVSRLVRILPEDSLATAVEVVQDPKIPNLFTYTIKDSARYDSATWLVNQTPWDSVGFLHFSGNRLRFLFTRTGCFQVHLMTYGKKSFGWAYSPACVDSLAGEGVRSNLFIPCYPNPVIDQVTTILNLGKAQNVQVLIYNSMGNEVQHNTISGTAGDNWISIPVANLPKGVYYIRFIYGNDTRRSRFLKG
jgi:hypothetical protein